MNRRMVMSLLGDVLLIIGAVLVLPLLVGIVCGEHAAWSILATMGICAALGLALHFLRP